jgi:tetraacyldisaccharide 4'-kinase
MRFPDVPSPARRILLAPLALAYAAGSALHRALLLRPRRARHEADREPRPPLIVIGSLRAGGAGKTPVAREVARHFSARGLRVGVLAYSIRRRRASPNGAAFTEVFPDSDWRAGSDEAVLLARGLAGSGARVFLTRDRERAWGALARAGSLDLLVSDDGLMDSRLTGAFRVILADQGERPGVFDLLPAGPYRMTAGALVGADLVLRSGEGFTRDPVIPPEVNLEKPHWILCGLGNPASFVRSLARAGVRVAGATTAPDHGVPDLGRARREAGRAGIDRFLCSEKDWIKLRHHPDRPPGLFPVGETVTLSPDFLAALGAFPAPPTS